MPGTHALDYLELGKLLIANRDKTVGDVLSCKGPLWDRLLEPFFLAALNTKPEIGSAALAAQLVRETFAKGGRAFRPRIAHPTLAAAFIEPAVNYLSGKGARVRLGERLKTITLDLDRVIALEIADRTQPIGTDDVIVLATPPWVTGELLPDVPVPDEFQRHRQRAFQDRASAERTRHAGIDWRHGGMGVCVSRPHFGDGLGCGPSRGYEPRRAG